MFVVDIFYGGEALTAEQPQAFSCPYCSKMGFTEALLQEHVTAEHADTSVEVVSIDFYIFEALVNLIIQY